MLHEGFLMRTSARFVYWTNKLLADAGKPLPTPEIAHLLTADPTKPGRRRRHTPTVNQLNNLMCGNPRAFTKVGKTTGHRKVNLWTNNRVACSLHCNKLYEEIRVCKC